MDFIHGLRRIYDGSLEIHDTECRRSIKPRHRPFISLNAENALGPKIPEARTVIAEGILLCISLLDEFQANPAKGL